MSGAISKGAGSVPLKIEPGFTPVNTSPPTRSEREPAHERLDRESQDSLRPTQVAAPPSATEKEPAELEAINHAVPEIDMAFHIIPKLSPKKLERLLGMTWTGNKATFKRLLDASLRGDASCT